MPTLTPSSTRSATPLHLIIERSASLDRLLLISHGLALLAVWGTPVDAPARLILTTVVLLSLWRARSHPLDASGLTLTPEGLWEIIPARGEDALIARLETSTVVTPWIVLLHLSTESTRFALPLCRDALDPESFRRLRVYLRQTPLTR